MENLLGAELNPMDVYTDVVDVYTTLTVVAETDTAVKLSDGASARKTCDGVSGYVVCTPASAATTPPEAPARQYSVQFKSNNGTVTRPDYQPMTHEQAVAFKSKFSKHPARHVEIYELNVDTMGAEGNERLSCVFCIMGSENDLSHGRAKRPELFDKYVALEAETGSTVFHSKSLADIAVVSA